jgi:hypothetical protein
LRAVLIERQPAARVVGAGLGGGHEILGALRQPAYRPAELARRPQDEGELDIDPIARAKIAADIVRQHPHPFGSDPQHRGELGLLADCTPASGEKRVAIAGRVVMAEG